MKSLEKTILVIEDERPLANAIKTKLEKNNFNVVIADKVDQALDYLKDPDMTFDAIWLDHYLLGNKTGLDFLDQCRNKNACPANMPIYAVTNTGGHEKKETYLRLGANKYYIKSDHKLEQIVEDIKSDLLN